MRFRPTMVLTVWTVLAANLMAADPIDIGSRRELFVDRCLIESMSNATLHLHRPTPAEIVLQREHPWEGFYTFGYMTVLKDGDRYRLYYRSYPGSEAADGDEKEMTCYAESTDGIHWTKPELGRYDFQGSKRNNIILANAKPFTHNFSPFIDLRSGAPAEERYKALGGVYPVGLAAFVSADGIHWKKLQEEPVLKTKEWAFDSQNVAFWSESEKCYVCYFRTMLDKVRTISRATSPDFLHWTTPVPMQYGDTGPKPPENLYINQTQPYFRAPHIYIATPARFMEGRCALSDAEVKELDIDASCEWLLKDCSDVALMSSRGGDRYDRTFMEAWITPGMGLRNWVSRSNYPACGIVPTGPSEMSIYLYRHNAQESGHVTRYTLRTDGFVSIRAGYQAGEMVTKPLVFAGKALDINYSTSAAGSVRIEIQDATGKPIPGFALDDCSEIYGDHIDRVVAWKDNSDLGKLAGIPVRVRFVLKDADLYSICFQ